MQFSVPVWTSHQKRDIETLRRSKRGQQGGFVPSRISLHMLVFHYMEQDILQILCRMHCKKVLVIFLVTSVAFFLCAWHKEVLTIRLSVVEKLSSFVNLVSSFRKPINQHFWWVLLLLLLLFVCLFVCLLLQICSWSSPWFHSGTNLHTAKTLRLLQPHFFGCLSCISVSKQVFLIESSL